ncbi:hypothetical protein, partial [Rhodococcus sp. DK17]|uniref:hypothetical protein n=1 Tax=Rhodococcus sp. DK17 TaxID=186196 RepID=UPI001ED9327A
MGVEVAEGAVSGAVVGGVVELFFDGGEGVSGGGSAGEGVVEVDVGEVEEGGVDGGEPAEGVGEVGAGDVGVGAAVAFDGDEQGVGGGVV